MFASIVFEHAIGANGDIEWIINDTSIMNQGAYSSKPCRDAVSLRFHSYRTLLCFQSNEAFALVWMDLFCPATSLTQFGQFFLSFSCARLFLSVL